MDTRKTRPTPKPFPAIRPDPVGLETVFAEPLRTFGARQPGTLAGQLAKLDMLAEEPTRIVKSLLAAPELLEWERVTRDGTRAIVAAAELVIADLDQLARALAATESRFVIVSEPVGGESRVLVANVRHAMAMLARQAAIPPGPPQREPNPGHVAVALEILARAALAGIPRPVSLTEDPVIGWACDTAVALCGRVGKIRTRRAEAIGQLAAFLTDPAGSPLSGNLGIAIHPALYPAIRETVAKAKE